MTYADLQAEVFRRLEEAMTAPVYWTVADVQEALLQAAAELADETEWLETYQTVDLLDDRPYYDVRTLLGEDVLSLGPAFNDQTQRWLTPTTVQALDRGDARWERQQTEPTRVITRGLWWLGYWPRVQTDAGTVKQYLTRLPAALVEDADEPGFPAAYHYTLVDGALADLWAQDGNGPLATEAWTAYLAGEASVRDWVQHRASVPSVRMER